MNEYSKMFLEIFRDTEEYEDRVDYVSDERCRATTAIEDLDKHFNSLIVIHRILARDMTELMDAMASLLENPSQETRADLVAKAIILRSIIEQDTYLQDIVEEEAHG